MDYRPITSALRASFFNYLSDNIKECIFLDGFAGTGILGFEALSRGASKIIFVEQNHAAALLIEKNIHHLGQTKNGKVICTRIEKFLKQPFSASQLNIIFLDPPFIYPQEGIKKLLEYIIRNRLLSNHGIIAVRYQKYRGKLQLEYDELRLIKEFKESEAYLAIYQCTFFSAEKPSE